MLRALLLVIVLGVPSLAQALPVVVGCCDSLTFQPDRTYMSLLNVDPMHPDFQVVTTPAIPSQTTAQAVVTLESYLSSSPADIVVLLTGTPDTFFSPTGFGSQAYDQNATLGNIETMITDVQNAGAKPILVSPLPVLDKYCDGSLQPDCAEINTRLTNLSSALAALAGTDNLPFVDLHTIFAGLGQTGLAAVLKPDGVHPTHDGGDPIIADAIRPVLTPEPGTLLLLTAGLVGLGAFGRRSRRV